MLLNLLWDTFMERRKYLLPWGAGLVLVVLTVLLIRPGSFISDIFSQTPTSASISFPSGSWLGETNYGVLLLYFLVAVYLIVFAIFEGSRLLTPAASRNNLTLFLSYPLPRWKLLAARLVYLVCVGLSSVVLVYTLGIIAALLLPAQLNWLSISWQGFKLFFIEMGFAVFSALIATLTKRTWVGILAGNGGVILMLAAYLIPVQFPDLGWMQWFSSFLYLFPSSLPIFGQFTALFGGVIIWLFGLGYVFETADLD